jgi:hypothetical protein
MSRILFSTVKNVTVINFKAGNFAAKFCAIKNPLKLVNDVFTIQESAISSKKQQFEQGYIGAFDGNKGKI